MACQSTDAEVASTTETPTTPAITPTPEAKATPAESKKSNVTGGLKTKPIYMDTEVGRIPVYSSFEGVEDLFKQKNDTTYVINFWATWCKPCVKELPYFERVQEKYKDEKVQVILVSLDFKRQLKKKLKPFLEERKMKSKVVVLTDNKYNNWIDRVDTNWSGAIPVTVIYNAKGRRFIGKAVSDFEELDRIVQRVVAS